MERNHLVQHSVYHSILLVKWNFPLLEMLLVSYSSRILCDVPVCVVCRENTCLPYSAIQYYWSLLTLYVHQFHDISSFLSQIFKHLNLHSTPKYLFLNLIKRLLPCPWVTTQWYHTHTHTHLHMDMNIAFQNMLCIYSLYNYTQVN